MKLLTKLYLLVLAVLLVGCGTAGLRLGHDPRPKSPDIDTVRQKLCRGDDVGALRYLEDRGLPAPDREERIEQARRKNAQDPTWCVSPALTPTAADAALLARLGGDTQSAIAALEVVGVDHESAARRITAAANATTPGGH